MTAAAFAPHVQIVADHSALLAIPAFAPAILVVGVVIWVARRDRRLGPDGGEGPDGEGPDGEDRAHSEYPASAEEDGPP